MSYRARSYSNPLYNTWKDMRKRCSNPNRRDYKWYGGKGITVCSLWQVSFTAFVDEMLPTYFPGATLDRKDNSKGYYKDNCQWSTRQQQAEHRGNVYQLWNRAIEMKALYDGGYSQEEIAKMLGCSQGSVSRILLYGR